MKVDTLIQRVVLGESAKSVVTALVEDWDANLAREYGELLARRDRGGSLTPVVRDDGTTSHFLDKEGNSVSWEEYTSAARINPRETELMNMWIAARAQYPIPEDDPWGALSPLPPEFSHLDPETYRGR